MSKIEWTDATWNPIAGCSPVSPGCTNCYAMSTAARLQRMITATHGNARHYHGLTQRSKAGPVWTGKVALAGDDRLTEPLRRRKPTRYFVNSMSDLFHDGVEDAWIDRIFAVMALAPQHTFQVLTKRSARMRGYLTDSTRHDRISIAIADREGADYTNFDWPLPNVWLGVSAEDQERADQRIPDLLATPAALRFASIEPMLGPIDLTWLPWPDDLDGASCGDGVMDALRGHAWIRGTEDWPGHPVMPNWRYKDGSSGPRQYLNDAENTFGRLDWVIVGGESGAHARPMHPQWPRDIRDQCAAAGVPFFFKQWGEWRTRGFAANNEWIAGPFEPVNGRTIVAPWGRDDVVMARVGKRRAGRLLDGVEHSAFPALATPERQLFARANSESDGSAPMDAPQAREDSPETPPDPRT